MRFIIILSAVVVVVVQSQLIKNVHPLSASIEIKKKPQSEPDIDKEINDEMLKILEAIRSHNLANSASGKTYMTDLTKWEECDKEFGIVKYMYERILEEHNRLVGIEVYLNLCNRICIGVNLLIALGCLVVIGVKLINRRRYKKASCRRRMRSHYPTNILSSEQQSSYFDTDYHHDKVLPSLLPPPPPPSSEEV